MKVLVAYDGSASADAAVVDMRRAGLPKDAEVLVISVVEASVTQASGPDVPASAVRQASKTDLYEGQALVDTVHKWIQSNFPEWKADTTGTGGFAGNRYFRKSALMASGFDCHRVARAVIGWECFAWQHLAEADA